MTTPPEEGAMIAIEVDPADPTTSRVVDVRRRSFDPWALLVLVFPIAGLVLFLALVRTGCRDAVLLRTAHLLDARVVGLLRKVDSEGAESHVTTLEFTHEGATWSVEVLRAPSRYSVTGIIPMFVDPRFPGRARAPDDLPGRPWLEGDRVRFDGGWPIPQLVLMISTLVVSAAAGVLII